MQAGVASPANRRGGRLRITAYRLGAGLVVLGLVVLLAPIGATGQSESPSDGSFVGHDAVAPSLTSEQVRRAEELLASDPFAQEILRANPFEISDIGPWGGYDVEGNPEPIIGVALRLTLKEPASFEMREWPLIQNEPAAGRPYDAMQVRMEAQNVREFLVNIDLQTEEVVYFDPFGDSVKITPGRDYVTVPPAETKAGE